MQNPSKTQFLTGSWTAVSIAFLTTTRNKMIFLTVVLVTDKNALMTGEYMMSCGRD